MREDQRTPQLVDVIQRALDGRLSGLNTSIPGQVTRYDPSTQLVDVQPLIQVAYAAEDGSTVTQTLPIVPNCPLVFPGSGGFRLTFPVNVGDGVLLVFSQQSIDKWAHQGGVTDPKDPRRFSLTDGIAIPGLHPFTSPWTGASQVGVTLGKDGGMQIEVDAASVSLGLGATEAVVKGTTYRAAENVLITGIGTAITALSTSLGLMATAMTSIATNLPPSSAPCTAAATGVTGALTSAMTTYAAVVTTFNAASAAYLSAVVKTT